MKQARAVQDELQRERYRGPLQGIPYAVKDLLSVAGRVTTWGAKPYAKQQFDFDATVIERLAGVGAVLTGKLSMVELAGGGEYRYASASLFGPGLNPWDTSRWSGGSSSGSGSAVAAGLVPFALGSETSGSILTPSAFCGVTGLRPTYGLVSRYGAMPLSWTMDKIGPMCRSAEDCAHVLQVIAGKDNRDPGTAGKKFYYVSRYSRDVKGIRVGYAPVDFEVWAEPQTRSAFQSALDALRSLGIQMSEVKLGDFPYGPIANTVISAEGASVFEELIESGRINELADERQIAGLRAGLEIAARDYLKAMRVRRLVQQSFRRVFADVAILVAPSQYSVAPKIDEPLDRIRPPGLATDTSPAGMSELIPAGNLAGLPALSLPCGMVNGLPIGIQLVGRAFTENRILGLGVAFQNATKWHKQRPPV
jgi:aspartyl-tRNA(Asn)/glutamyl-tRNA(Gln) amidotransferase subunit A